MQTVHEALDDLLGKNEIARRFTVAGDAVYLKTRGMDRNGSGNGIEYETGFLKND